MHLTSQEFGRAREILLQADLGSLALFMHRLQLGENASDAPAAIRATAAELGWVDPGTLALTERGWFAADSCREYRFWTDRGRQLPFAEAAPNLVSEDLAGDAVLEIGSGSGANLMSLAGNVQDLVGIEPVGMYRQLGSVFAEREKLGGIRMVAGSAEAIPFPNARFDAVLCVSAHQYFDIVAAFREIERVLKPGGRLVIIGGTLPSYLRDGFENVARGSLSAAKGYLVTIVNTLGYMAVRKRPLVRRSAWSTAYPVYPSRGAMGRFIAEAGLRIDRPLSSIGSETCFRARKPG